MAPVDGSLGPLPPLPLHLYIRLTLKWQSLEFLKNWIKTPATSGFFLSLSSSSLCCLLHSVSSLALGTYPEMSKDHWRRIRQKRRQRSSLLAGGQNLFNSMPHSRFSTKMIWKKLWIEERMYTWRVECFGKMDDHLILQQQTTTLTKWMFFQKPFFKSSLLPNGIQVCSPNRSDDLCRLLCLILLL